jgi:glycosyltransferase involved in cell wall biosynthesis
MSRVPITIVVPARNEAPRIVAFLAAHAWADECIVVDNGSTDATAQAAAAAGARVLSHPVGTIADARNAGADAATHEWILALDCDEVADAAMGEEIAELLTAPSATAYRIRRRNFYLGREQRRGQWGKDWVVRLYRKPQRYALRKVHESLETTGAVKDLSATLRHEPYRDLSHHIEKMDRYARWGAEELFAAGRRATVVDLTLRPLWRFVKAYLLTGHCLDGRFGLVTSLLGTQTAFLKYAHLWAMERKGSTPLPRR